MPQRQDNPYRHSGLNHINFKKSIRVSSSMKYKKLGGDFL